MTKDLSKKSLFRLLDGFTSEREIKKYLQRFESDQLRTQAKQSSKLKAIEFVF